MTQSYDKLIVDDNKKTSHFAIKTVWRDELHLDPYIDQISREDLRKYKQFLKVADCLDAFLFNGTLYRVER